MQKGLSDTSIKRNILLNIVFNFQQKFDSTCRRRPQANQYLDGSLLELGTALFIAMYCKSSVDSERFRWELSNALN